jgi:hypothetical protein
MIDDWVVSVTVNDRVATFILAGKSVHPPDQVFQLLFLCAAAVRI